MYVNCLSSLKIQLFTTNKLPMIKGFGQWFFIARQQQKITTDQACWYLNERYVYEEFEYRS